MLCIRLLFLLPKDQKKIKNVHDSRNYQIQKKSMCQERSPLHLFFRAVQKNVHDSRNHQIQKKSMCQERFASTFFL